VARAELTDTGSACPDDLPFSVMSEQEPQSVDREPERDPRTGREAAAKRMEHQTQWVELQLRRAMERGDFDDLPGYGKPIEGLGTEHDPDWWLKKLIEREHVTGVLPPSLQIRKDDAELDGVLDRLATETEVRRELEDFNERVRRARIQPLGGPPMITPERDVEAEVEAWRSRRDERRAAQRAAARRQAVDKSSEPHRRWWQRR
jgi:hypothetical protein